MKVTINTVLYTLASRALLIIFFILISVPLVICLLLPQKLLVNNPLFQFVSQIFYWYCLKFSFLPISYKGLGNIPKEPCIIVANHQSGFDIPLVGYTLKNRPHLWLALASLTKESPLLRIILPRNAVLVDTGSPTRGARTLVEAISLVKKHPWDLIIFPEGGRYTDNKIHEFFGGFAAITKKINRPVVPIKIIGVNKVYPPDSFWIYYYPIHVVIGKPMHMEPGETEESFKERVYQWYTHDGTE